MQKTYKNGFFLFHFQWMESLLFQFLKQRRCDLLLPPHITVIQRVTQISTFHSVYFKQNLFPSSAFFIGRRVLKGTFHVIANGVKQSKTLYCNGFLHAIALAMTLLCSFSTPTVPLIARFNNKII